MNTFREEVIKLVSSGKTQGEISKELKVTRSTVLYWINEDYRRRQIDKAKKRSKLRWENISKEEREAYNLSRREYNKKYQNQRYHNDPVFKKNHIARVMKSKKKVSS